MFLNNLLLAFITQEFRWLFIRLTRNLNKSINLSKVFLFVFALFNLQGTVAVRCAVSLLILSQDF